MIMENLDAKRKQLEKFVGKWTTVGQILPTSKNAGADIRGQESYEWLEGEYFLLHNSELEIGDHHQRTLEVFSFEEQESHFITQFYDNIGNSGQFQVTLMDDLWIFSGETLLFKGGFSENETVFSGVWEQHNQEKIWVPYMNIKLVKEV
jgi:hypothetical protein